MYGENLGMGTLVESLARIASRIAERRDDGYGADEDMLDDARSLMEGSMVLWRELAEEMTEALCSLNEHGK